MTDAKIEMLVKTRDGLRMAADSIDEYLESIAPVRGREDLPADMQGIVWTPESGQRGPFEKSDDLDNPRFKTLIHVLEAHSGKMTVDDYFVWLFPDGKVIGRKKK